MYNIATSRGIVLKKYPVGESHSIVTILTEEYGLLRVHARSVRLERSKLRYGVEPLTTARFAFVRGKHEWRLVGAEQITGFAGDISATAAAGRIVLLLLRLIQGQEPIPLVYEAAEQGLSTLASADRTTLAPVEWVLVLRILAHLGYVSPPDALLPFLTDNTFSTGLLSQAEQSRRLLVSMINESLRASDL